MTRLSEHQRAKYIGRVFQDPMMGTAATMQIDENLALAARRGQARTLQDRHHAEASATNTTSCSKCWIWGWRTA